MLDEIHDAFRYLRLQEIAPRSKERTFDVPTNERRHPHNGEVAARLSLFGRYNRLLIDRRRALHSREAGPEIASQRGVTLLLARNKFFQTEVDYLGHVIKPGVLVMAPEMSKAVAQAKPPTNVREKRSFLGLFSVNRRFVKNFSQIAAPLNAYPKKEQPTTWDDLDKDAMHTFERLKTALVSPPVLVLPRQTGFLMLETDVTDYQIGEVLLQRQENGEN